MEDTINAFLEIIKENSATFKKFSIPDYVLNPHRHLDGYSNSQDWTQCDDDLIEERKVDIDDLQLFLNQDFEEFDGGNVTEFYLNGFKEPQELDNKLDDLVLKFKETFAENNLWKDNSYSKNIVQSIKKSKTELEDVILFTRNKISWQIHNLLKAKIEYCTEVINFIRNPPIIINNGDSKPKASSRKIPALEKQTILTQNQIVILFHYLRELKLIGIGLTNNVYAQHISELTGFSSEKIRQNLSHVNKDSNSVDSGRITDTDFNIAKRELRKMVDKIETDTK